MTDFMATGACRTLRLRRMGQWIVAVSAIGLVAGCSSDDGLEAQRDAARDRAPEAARSDSSIDAVDATAVTCTLNGVTYSPGAAIIMPNDCGRTCRCMSTGRIEQCTGGCDSGSIDVHPVDAEADAPPIACVRGGTTYLPGDTVPLHDGCGGSCVCMSNGTLGRCVDTCDAARDVAMDGPRNDGALIPDTRPADVTPIDTACAMGTACNTATGTKGLCVAGGCRPCAGAQDDTNCSAIYGAGTICADGECVAGTCHDSAVCASGRVCDTTHTCRNCASDLQCQNDSVYGRGTICLSNGQCTTGTCHTSSDCLGKKLCDVAVHTCSSCTTDAQCQADTVYGNKSVCVSSQCVSGTCATTNDCKSMGRLCPSSTKICTECTQDSQCRQDSAYGSGTICVAGQCVSGTCNDSGDCPAGRICNTTSRACVACANDNQCKNDTHYGQHTICLASGTCATGDCHDDSSDCSAGRLCGSTVPHACGDCTTDAQCQQDDSYGTGYICVGHLCVQGDCHDTSNDCTSTKAGLVCGATTPHTCSNCSADDQCKNDPKYGTNTMCTTTTGLSSTGKCVSNTCSNNNQACTGNVRDFCCGSRCVAGNCCEDADCAANPIYGDNFVCRQNTCTRCDAVTGSSYLVDPVNGDDEVATGSGTMGGTAMGVCSFKTLTRALAVIGSPTAVTTITIAGGTSTQPVSLYTVRATGETAPVETLPIQIPANVTVTTKNGPVKLTPGTDKVGFALMGDKATLAPIATGLLTIDGGNHASGTGIVVTATGGTAVLSNVTVLNTKDDGIQVSEGTLRIGAGVTVRGAGTASVKQNGLFVTGNGTVNIVVEEGQTTTVFESNSESGIAVSGTAVLNITGATSTADVRTVVARSNAGSNVNFGQAPGATTLSTINGLYAASSTNGDGLLITAGSRIRVRNSVFHSNAGNGIRIAASEDSSAVTNIDLGTTSSHGRNTLQTSSSSSRNAGAGLCVAIGNNATAQTLSAAGNLFASRDCTSSGAGAIRTSANCTANTDLAVNTGTNVTVTTTYCTQ